MTTEERAGRLERQNRRLRWTLAAFVGMLVVGGVAGLKYERDDSAVRQRPAAMPTVVQAGRFEVVDADGNVIAAMGMNWPRTGGVVYTNNRTGALVAQTGAADDGRGVVWTYGRDGEPREDIR